jgi:phage-related protein
MTTRLYDYIITVANTAPFKNGNNFIGVGSGTYGYIANVNHATGNIKVKVSNVYQEYQVNEVVTSNHYLISNTAIVDTYGLGLVGFAFVVPATVVPNYASELSLYDPSGKVIPREDWTYYGDNTTVVFRQAYNGTITLRRDTGNTYAPSFSASELSIGNNQASVSTTITAITNSPFIRSKNAFTQPPIVRLVTFYYPGEWYPPNEKGNPSGSGAGLSWPADTPWRIAEVIGDIHSDLNYNVTFGGESYIAYPMETDGIGTSSDGTIDRVTIRVSNYDNVITDFIENPYLVGNVTSNSAVGYVNGELLNGLDPATVVGHNAYNQTTVDSYYGGKTNVAWSYTRAVAAGYTSTWKNLKYDSRDFLGGVVEIKSTLASHLQYWPEYSKLSNLEFSNLIQVYNSAPYRVGDNVKTNTSNTDIYVVSLLDDNYILLNSPLSNAATEQPLYIINSEHDPEAYVKDTFKITELTALNENFAEFSLTSWLQYFKLTLPKRKFYKNTCQWDYKGSECQYPGPNGGIIPGTFPSRSANVNPITTSNEIGVTYSDDECAKSYEACKVRNNTIHFGAFPGTGRQVPKQ